MPRTTSQKPAPVSVHPLSPQRKLRRALLSAAVPAFAMLAAAAIIEKKSGMPFRENEYHESIRRTEEMQKRINNAPISDLLETLKPRERSELESIVEELTQKMMKEKELNPTYLAPDVIVKNAKPYFILRRLDPYSKVVFRRIYLSHQKQFDAWAKEYIKGKKELVGFGKIFTHRSSNLKPLIILSLIMQVIFTKGIYEMATRIALLLHEAREQKNSTQK